MLRQIEVQERIAGSSARKADQSRSATHVASAPRLAFERAISPGRPPTLSAQLQPVERILDAEHRRRVDRLALEDALGELAALGHAEDLRHRPRRRVALEPLDGARPQHQHAVRALAAQHLLPGPGDDIELVPRQVHGEHGRGRVADRQALAVVGDPVAVRHPHARGRAVPGEDDVVRPVDRAEVGELAVGAPSACACP